MAERDTKLFPILTPELIEKLLPYGETITLTPGEVLFDQGTVADRMLVIVSGCVRVTRRAGAQEVLLVDHEAGAFTGEIGLLTGGLCIATARVIELGEAIAIPVDEIRHVFRDHPEVQDVILPAMAARRPEADADLMQREKMAALGKMAAGLAHELNNPAAAIMRASSQLVDVLVMMTRNASELIGDTDEATETLRNILARIIHHESLPDLDPLDRSDREEELTDWLEAHDAAEAAALATDLADAGVTVENLEKIHALLPANCLNALVTWLAASSAAVNLSRQMEESAKRMSELVGAVKSFTFMDKGGRDKIDVNKGLKTTLTLLNHKLRGVTIDKELDADLKPVMACGSALNQVWMNLLDNAIDAVKSGGNPGEISVRTHAVRDQVVVEIADNGPGIPESAQAHIFEPFYTTKGVGEGTGLGLDTAYRVIVSEHNGNISFHSEPGKTVFEVRLPARA